MSWAQQLKLVLHFYAVLKGNKGPLDLEVVHVKWNPLLNIRTQGNKGTGPRSSIPNDRNHWFSCLSNLARYMFYTVPTSCTIACKCACVEQQGPLLDVCPVWMIEGKPTGSLCPTRPYWALPVSTICIETGRAQKCHQTLTEVAVFWETARHNPMQ